MTLAEQTVRPSTLRLRRLTAAALTAALTAALGPFSFSVGTVPFTVQTFGVILAALLLPGGWAAGAMGLYVVLGAAGLPVFAKGAAGLGVLAGPTGGYLIGFVLAAGIAAAGRRAMVRAGVGETKADVAAGIIVMLVVDVVGTVWLAAQLHLAPAAALSVGVLPFIPADIAKLVVALIIASAVRKAGVRL